MNLEQFGAQLESCFEMAPALNGRARARSARASAQCVTAKKKGVAHTYGLASLALVASVAPLAVPDIL